MRVMLDNVRHGRASLGLAFSLIFCLFATESRATGPEKFAVYYSDQAPLERLEAYELLVLDSDHHPPLQALSEKGKILLGYLSLGEIEKRMPYYSTLRKKGLLLNENQNWKDSYTVDMRNEQWAKMVIEDLIPGLLAKGFHGIFLDTLDSPLELERRNPKRFTGMRDASQRLIRAIRLHYPTIKIMVNRGYELLPEIAPEIDMVLGESIYGDYDFKKKTYFKVEDALYQQQVKWLKDAKERNARLAIHTLDYADKKDTQTIADIYRTQRANGFIPYVATVNLDELVEEPIAP